MGLAKEKPLFAVQTDYEDDGYAWCYEQAELLRQRRFSEVDLTNVVQELEDMGSEKRFALRSSYRVLLHHLLKWEFQPERRSRSWLGTIVRERINVMERLQESPSLKHRLEELVEHAYRLARREAVAETGLSPDTFPTSIPYTLAQLDDPDFLPGPEEPRP